MFTNRIIALLLVTLLTACSNEGAQQTTHEPDSVAHEQLVGNPEADTDVDTEPEPKPQEKVYDQNEEFDAFKETFLSKMWELFPGNGVYVGYYKYDDQLRVPNGELRAKRREFYVNELQALKGFDANRLTSSNATDLAIIEGQLRANLWYMDSFRSYEWNPAEYNPAGVFGLILNTDYKPLDERMLTVSTRLENVPAYYEAAIDALKTPTLEHLGLAIRQTKGALNLFESQIGEKADQVTLTEEQRALLDTRIAAAVEAVKGYLQWLEAKDTELRASGEARDFRIGAELYEKKFKHDIASGYTAEELYQLAIQAKDELHSEMISITRDLWPTYFPNTEMPADGLVAVKQMIDHLSLNHIERENFVDEIKRQIPVLQQFVDEQQLLDSDPTRPLVVRLTPEYQRGFAGASVNAPGPYDATANTYYNVSPLDDYTDEQAESYLREYNHWILQILNIHEAIPGHYTQLMHANKSASKIKSIYGNGAMIEGWAVYSERMMLEAGYANNEPEMWLMYGKWNLRVVVNTILDYSVQVLGMERQAALDLLMNEAFQERTEAEGKWHRATVSQVQLTSYFSGYSEIYAFREELKKRLGDAFNLRDFHNAFLSYGNAPVPVIKNLMLAQLDASQRDEPKSEQANQRDLEAEPQQASAEESSDVDETSEADTSK